MTAERAGTAGSTPRRVARQRRSICLPVDDATSEGVRPQDQNAANHGAACAAEFRGDVPAQRVSAPSSRSQILLTGFRSYVTCRIRITASNQKGRFDMIRRTLSYPEMADPMVRPRYTGIATFMRAPFSEDWLSSTSRSWVCRSMAV
jgi:hypothetical protein